MNNRGDEPGQPSISPPDAAGGHRMELLERGPFLAARCSCGWSSPARRSRPLARTEAAAHLGHRFPA
ncbi:hypothetical protein RM844_29310 [Streptomyces sp. DSM 44915]|uniref:Uncharacterized protein n=1 Tax=Streptomyces chisholmiae TaxID=3075540 RepID=A0ABU2JZE2_9ACTN|nr:hypothetical protein [Streptomyces sp. DSM 44915]MDT0270378.1 hypothetical protein [Streptomyces sp. DSM 44915]